MTQAGEKAKHVCIWLCLALSAQLAVWPSFSDALANIRQTFELSGYAASCADMEPEARRRCFLRADAYNAGIAEEQKTESFSYRGEEATDSLYESLPGTEEGGVMAYLSVPRLGIDLPVVHGTRAEDLEYRCGHMYGTSLPTGGRNTHAVLAAHTGLPSAELFSRLTELKEGDRFEVRVLGETHLYEVICIRVVWPEEESAYLGVEQGKDLITLYTCTPYGINDHRLLVRGERRLPDPVRLAKGEELAISGKSREAAVRAAILGSTGPDVLLIGVLCGRRKKRKERQRR